MRTVILANNRLGARVADVLARRDELAGVVVHPLDRRRGMDAVDEMGAPVWTWPDGLSEIAAIEPACLLSVLFGYRLPHEWLALPRWKAINLHPGLLPFNKGANPNVWPLVDGTPAGTTLHVMDLHLDTGAILAQAEVETFPDDTAWTLYQRLEDASVTLFESAWPNIASCPERPQEGQGTYHRLADLATLDLTAADLVTLDKLRARHFPPFGATFERDGRRFRVHVEIVPDDDD